MLFFSVSRKGDNIPETKAGFETGHHVSKADIKIEGGKAGRYMVLRRTKDKTAKLDGAFAGKPLPEGESQLCAFTAISTLNEMDPIRNHEDPAKIPLFRHTNGQPITGPELLKFLRVMLKVVGEVPEHFGTHSLRIGGATLAMACPGSSEYTVRMMGYWAGDSIRLYTRPTRDAIIDLAKTMMSATTLNVFRPNE